MTLIYDVEIIEKDGSRTPRLVGLRDFLTATEAAMIIVKTENKKVSISITDIQIASLLKAPKFDFSFSKKTGLLKYKQQLRLVTT